MLAYRMKRTVRELHIEVEAFVKAQEDIERLSIRMLYVNEASFAKRLPAAVHY